MRLFIPILLLCLTVVWAQEAMPLLRFRAVSQEAWKKGKKGDKTPVKGGKEALLKQIDDLQQKTANANETIVPFKGGSLKGLTGLLKVNLAVTQLGKTLDTTTATAQATDTLSSKDSGDIGVKFLALQPDITNLIGNLKEKRPEFDKAGFKILDVRSLIRDSVTIQKDKADDLGLAFKKALDAQFQPVAAQISDQIQGNFTDAIQEFKGRGGKIKIPTKLVPKLSKLLAAVAKALGLGKMDTAMGKDLMMAEGLLAPEPDSTEMTDAAEMTDALNSEAAISDIAIADTAQASMAIEEAMQATSEADLMRLGNDENDLRGISPLVLAVLRSYEVIA
ncbi:hydrophobic surface binding protein A-domain-containing protein [Colletotrichum cereale]|nr:hydrophobic surface binding protein A-domain-containing protein [Colletotrichum cereale]